jgi:hypothetical protein
MVPGLLQAGLWSLVPTSSSTRRVEDLDTLLRLNVRSIFTDLYAPPKAEKSIGTNA